MVTLESVLEYHNMRTAMTQVIKNRGAAGFDGIPVSELEQWFREHPHQLSKAVMSGTYKPQPIKRVYIPKDNGDKRPLGIPTVVDSVTNSVKMIHRGADKKLDMIFSS